MRKKEIMEKLEKCRTLRRMITSRINQISEIRELTASVGAIRYDSIRVQASPENRIENAMIKLDDLTTRLADEIDELTYAFETARNMIEALDDRRYVEVLTLTYIDMLCASEIAKRMHYGDLHYVYRLRREAIDALSEKL